MKNLCSVGGWQRDLGQTMGSIEPWGYCLAGCCQPNPEHLARRDKAVALQEQN